MYFEFKNTIKEKIKEKHGGAKYFIERNPHLKLDDARLSRILNPSLNCELSTLMPILEALGMDLMPVKTPKIKASIKTG